MIEGVKNLKSYERSTDILEFSSDQGGMQKENREICYQKLDGSLRQIAADHVAREAAKDKVTLNRKEL